MEKLIIAGRVGKDAEIKDFNGTQYTAFSIAVDNSYKKHDGTKVEQTNWWNCLKQGTGIAPYIKKGQFLVVTGRIQVKQFTDGQGRQQISLNLNAQDVVLGPGGQADNATHTPREQYQTASNGNSFQATQAPTQQAPDLNLSDTDDDLPF